jgi:hypothetical protein
MFIKTVVFLVVLTPFIVAISGLLKQLRKLIKLFR